MEYAKLHRSYGREAYSNSSQILVLFVSILIIKKYLENNNLMAACDHEYKFTIVNIEAYGSENDGGIFARSSLGDAIDNDDLNLSANSAILSSSNQKMPYFFAVGAFKMSRHVMRSYPGRNLTIERKIQLQTFSS